MRTFLVIAVAVAALAAAPTASADIPESGYLVFKDSRLQSVVEVRLKGSGQLVYSAETLPGGEPGGPACSDPAYVFSGPRWKSFESYLVNTRSTPSYVSADLVLSDLRAAADAWETPFVTDCPRPDGKSTYDATYGGATSRRASLLGGFERDGANAVSFESLAGTVCDGATACVLVDYDKKVIVEADMALERDLTRYGFQDFWTTDDTTWWDDAGGRWAVSDVAAHEFGHFAGLAHTKSSPSLTMYPLVHDGAQTLGLGDMLGIIARY